MDFRHFLAFFLTEEVNCTLAGDAFDHSLFGENAYAPPGQ